MMKLDSFIIRLKFMHWLTLPRALLLLILSCGSVDPEREDARKVLFVGNSLTYANDLPRMVEALAAGEAWRAVRQIAKGSAFITQTLGWHPRSGSTGHGETPSGGC